MELNIQREQSTGTSSTDDRYQDPSSPSLRFAFGKFSPQWLQYFNTPRWFVVFAFTSTFIGNFVSNSITYVAPNSIERQFGITSAQIGALILAKNASLGLSCVVVGYLCRDNKPRWICVGLIIMSLGAVIVSLPKFIMGTYDVGDASGKERDFCAMRNKTTRVVSSTSEKSSSVYLTVFFVGFIVHGFGASVIWTLVPAHTEDVIDRTSSSVYIGIYQSISLAIAPAVGFLIGKPMLSQWVDIFQV